MLLNRSDRIALELHRRIADQPIYVVNRALLNAMKVKENSRGSARDAVNCWVTLLNDWDLSGIREHLIGDDELSRQMRNSSVFQGILTSDERNGIVNSVISAA